MTASFRKINYSLRPAKHAERKMLVEVVRRMSVFCPLADYQYVGFGSVWFSDFVLFHKALGFRNMVSIERHASAQARIEFNRPFQLEVMYESASSALPKLNWTGRKIVWLDYDSVLTTEILDDLRTVVSRSASGSVICVSIQCNRAQEVDEAAKAGNGDASAVDRFASKFGRRRVPGQLVAGDLIGWPFGSLSRKIIQSEIGEALERRNAPNTGEMGFHLISEIEYNDDALMTTIVGVIAEARDNDKIALCDFGSLDFATPGLTTRITMPKLTARELRFLEKQLPLRPEQELETGPIPRADAQNFASMYRYFPNFSVLEA